MDTATDVLSTACPVANSTRAGAAGVWHRQRMAILEEYWSGVLRRLEAEVDTFNRLIDHQGEKGRENELSLARIIEKLIPSRYGIGSGLLIDSEGNYSKQIDIVVFDSSNEPTLMAQTNQVLFPVENVLLCIEVKTTVDKSEIDDATSKMRSIRELRTRGRLPSFCLFGYSAAVSAKTLASHLQNSQDNYPIDFSCILQLGLFSARSDLVPHYDSSGDYVVGVTPLHQSVDGERLPGEFLAPDKGDSSPDILHNGHRYPVVNVAGRDLVGEPSRALLLFCDTMLLALKHPGQNSNFTHYITEIGREMVLVKQEIDPPRD